MSNPKQTARIDFEGSSAKVRRLTRFHALTFSSLALLAVTGCAGATTMSEEDADAVGDPSGSGESVATSAQAYTGPILDTDSVRVTGDKVDFGGSLWGIHSPIGSGTLTWRVVDGFYTPRLTGTLHMEDADGKYARMHISYWDGGGNLIYTRHGGIVQASGNSHQAWSVDLSPTTPMQIVEAHVCTELSDDGVDFPQVACESYIMN